MSDQSPDAACDGHDEAVVAYRHDAHKLHGRSHADAAETFAGVRINQRVPHGADRDAAALSRPSGEPTQTVDNHTSRYRLSLIDGDSQYNHQASQDGIERAVRDLLTETDSKDLHQAWLTSDVAARFNEAVSYPYTSLKYHTLLVAALLDNYRNGHQFNDLHLVVDDDETIIPHRTIYAGDEFALRITGADVSQPSAHLGRQPQRSWASTWTQLPAHPLDTDYDNDSMVLDANLRRIQSWSTALQYIEDYTEEFQR